MSCKDSMFELTGGTNYWMNRASVMPGRFYLPTQIIVGFCLGATGPLLLLIWMFCLSCFIWVEMFFRNPGGVLSLPHSLVYPPVWQKLKSKQKQVYAEPGNSFLSVGLWFPFFKVWHHWFVRKWIYLMRKYWCLNVRPSAVQKSSRADEGICDCRTCHSDVAPWASGRNSHVVQHINTYIR